MRYFYAICHKTTGKVRQSGETSFLAPLDFGPEFEFLWLKEALPAGYRRDVASGDFVPETEEAAEERRVFEIVALRADLYSRVRREAEEQRLRFLSPGTGKAMAYQQKALEAEGFVASSDPTAGEFPHIFEEAEALGVEPMTMAVIILTLRRQWQVASASIEKIEREAILSVEAADTLEALEALPPIDWTPLDQL